jgi:hypothetical protein
MEVSFTIPQYVIAAATSRHLEVLVQEPSHESLTVFLSLLLGFPYFSKREILPQIRVYFLIIF